MRNIIIIFFIFFGKSIFSQNNENYSTYELTKNKNGISLKSSGFLYVNSKTNESIFTLNQYENLINKNDKISKENNTVFLNKRAICFDNYKYYYDYKTKISKFNLYDYSCDTKRNIVENLKVPNWKIQKHNTKINGYSVNKATAKINDRIWNVYYSTKIKTNYNPWRFIGLEGLVIFAEDSTKTFTFKLKEFKNKESSNLDFLDNSIKNSTFYEFKSFAIDEYWKNVQNDFKSNSMIFNKEELPKYETLEFIEN